MNQLSQAALDFYAELSPAAQAIVHLLLTIPKGQMFSVTAETEHKMNKGRKPNQNPLYGRVRKRAKYSFRSQTYASRKEQLTGETEVKSLPWKEHAGEFITCHKEKGTIYIEAKPEKVSQVEYLIDGRPVTPQERKVMDEFAKPKSESKVEWAMIKIENVVAFHGCGEAIEV